MKNTENLQAFGYALVLDLMSHKTDSYIYAHSMVEDFNYHPDASIIDLDNGWMELYNQTVIPEKDAWQRNYEHNRLIGDYRINRKLLEMTRYVPEFIIDLTDEKEYHYTYFYNIYKSIYKGYWDKFSAGIMLAFEFITGLELKTSDLDQEFLEYILSENKTNSHLVYTFFECLFLVKQYLLDEEVDWNTYYKLYRELREVEIDSFL